MGGSASSVGLEQDRGRDTVIKLSAVFQFIYLIRFFVGFFEGFKLKEVGVGCRGLWELAAGDCGSWLQGIVGV